MSEDCVLCKYGWNSTVKESRMYFCFISERNYCIFNFFFLIYEIRGFQRMILHICELVSIFCTKYGIRMVSFVRNSTKKSLFERILAGVEISCTREEHSTNGVENDSILIAHPGFLSRRDASGEVRLRYREQNWRDSLYNLSPNITNIIYLPGNVTSFARNVISIDIFQNYKELYSISKISEKITFRRKW